MNKTLLALALSVTCINVVAHPSACDFSLDYNININDEQVRYSNDSGKIIVFMKDKLLINGKSVPLSTKQAKVSNQFLSETRILLPKVAEVAIEAAELGVKAATITITALAGEGEDVYDDFIKPIEIISNKVKSNITDHALNTKALKQSFDHEFEQAIEKLVEKVIRQYSGQIISDVITSIFSDDSEDLKDFEFRMENLGNDIEQYVESHVEALEIKAEKLCDSFKILADLDSQLERLEHYPTSGLIEINSKKGLNVSNLTVSLK